MSWTGKITKAVWADDNITITVHFNDTVTNYNKDHDFVYPADGTLTKAKLVTDVQAYGGILAKNQTIYLALQANIGTVINIP